MKEKQSLISQRVEVPINDSVIYVDLAGGRIKPKLGFLGPLGTFTEEAVEKIWGPERQVQEELLGTNKEVVRKVDSGEFDLGVVAAENSTEGDVMETLRELVHAKNTKILGEIVIPIRHVLIGKSNAVIKQIYSHPQALGQCSEYLATIHPDVQQVSTASTAKSADDILNMEGAAAIGSRRLA